MKGIGKVTDLLSGCDGKMETGLDSGVNGIVKSLGPATPKRHVGDGTLMFGLASSGNFMGSLLGVNGGLLSSPATRKISIQSKQG